MTFPASQFLQSHLLDPQDQRISQKDYQKEEAFFQNQFKKRRKQGDHPEQVQKYGIIILLGVPGLVSFAIKISRHLPPAGIACPTIIKTINAAG